MTTCVRREKQRTRHMCCCLCYEQTYSVSCIIRKCLSLAIQGYGKPVVLKARAHIRFYGVLLKLLGMCTATGSQGYSVLLALLYLGFSLLGFRWQSRVYTRQYSILCQKRKEENLIKGRFRSREARITRNNG